MGFVRSVRCASLSMRWESVAAIRPNGTSTCAITARRTHKMEEKDMLYVKDKIHHRMFIAATVVALAENMKGRNVCVCDEPPTGLDPDDYFLGFNEDDGDKKFTFGEEDIAIRVWDRLGVKLINGILRDMSNEGGWDKSVVSEEDISCLFKMLRDMFFVPSDDPGHIFNLPKTHIGLLPSVEEELERFNDAYGLIFVGVIISELTKIILLKEARKKKESEPSKLDRFLRNSEN